MTLLFLCVAKTTMRTMKDVAMEVILYVTDVIVEGRNTAYKLRKEQPISNT